MNFARNHGKRFASRYQINNRQLYSPLNAGQRKRSKKFN